MISNVTYTLNDILKQVSEYDILCHILKCTPSLPCTINSPLRKDDCPSFSLRYNNNGKISYFDYATKEYGGVIDLMQKMYKITFTEAIEQLNEAINDNILQIRDCNNNQNLLTCNYKNKKTKNNRKIEVSIRNFREHDVLYWKQFGISEHTLNYCNVYAISHIFITDTADNVTNVIRAEKYAYAYVEFKDGNTTFKIYQPYSENFKWINTNDASVWELWEQLPKTGKRLVITKSRKDAMTIMENWKVPSCSLQAEGYKPKEKVINDLKSRFKYIYILYDNDFTKEENYGRIHSSKLAEEFDLIQIEIPSKFEVKDSSDFVKKYGIKEFKKLYTNFIKNDG